MKTDKDLRDEFENETGLRARVWTHSYIGWLQQKLILPSSPEQKDPEMPEVKLSAVFEDMGLLSEQKPLSDGSKCDKCGGRTALVSGTFDYSADPEPFTSGIEEESTIKDGSRLVDAHICEDCKSIQNVADQK